MRNLSKSGAFSNAQEIIRQRYADCAFAFATGSIIQGRGTAGSDLDLVVLYPRLESAYQESFFCQDMPVEVFVHDYETIQALISIAYANGEARTAHMIAMGAVLPAACEASQKLQDYCAKILATGPPPLDEQQKNQLLYDITGLIDDLRGKRSYLEMLPVFYLLHTKFGELALRNSCQFVGLGKYLATDMQKIAPQLAQDLAAIGQTLHANQFGQRHIDILVNALEPFGGLLFDGYKRTAPSNKRQNPAWLV